MAYGQITTCPDAQTGNIACNCPSGYTACSTPFAGSLLYGGCAPNSVTKYQLVMVENNVGYCFYCEDGSNPLSITSGSGSSDEITCGNGVTYHPALPGETSTPIKSPVVAPVAAPAFQPAPAFRSTPAPFGFDTPFFLSFPSTVIIIRNSSSITSSSTTTTSCFAGSETLLLETGATVTMEDVQVGDKVLVASLDGKSTFYSPVMVLPHAANSIQTRFVQLSTVSGKDIKMTADHLVMSGVCGGSLSLVQAGSVKVGACLATVSGEEAVSAVSVVVGEGVYTVVPEKDALLVVNGVIASPFAVNHLIANAFYNIHRVVLSVAPSVMRTSFVSKVVSAFGELVAPASSSA